MNTLLRIFTKLFKQESELERFISSKHPQNSADVDHWTRYYYDSKSRYL